MTQLILSFFLLLYLSATQAAGQNLKFNRINTEDGLSQSGVSDIIQDDYGFMWFATQYGLSRYDGVKFDYFYQQLQGDNSLSASDIQRLDKDKNSIWVQTSHGLDAIDQVSLNIKNWSKIVYAKLIEQGYFDAKTKGSINDFRVNESHLFLLINDILFVSVELDSEELEIISLKAGHQSVKQFSGFLLLPDKQLLVTSKGCFYWFNLDEDYTYRQHFCPDTRVPFNRLETNSLQNGSLLLASERGLYIIDLAQPKERLIEVLDSSTGSNVGVTTIWDIGSGFWLGTESGLKFYDKSVQKITEEFYFDASDKFSISNNDILSLYLADNGILWAGTGLGVSLLKPDQKFSHLLRLSETETFKQSNLSSSITKDSNGDLWIGTTDSGLYRYQNNNGILNNYLTFSPNGSSEHPGFVSKILEDDSQRLIVLADNGLSIKDLSDRWFKTSTEFELDGEKYHYYSMLDIIQDSYSNYWIGGHDGLFKFENVNQDDLTFNFERARITNYADKFPKNFFQGDYPIYVIYEDLQRYIWLGGSNGVIRFNPNNLKVEHYTYEEDNSSSISSNDINTIYEDANGVLWIGTTNGLNRVYYNNNAEIRFKRLGVKDGFVSNYISAIQEDNKGFLWVSTIKGIVRYHPNNREPVINYLYEEGLQHHEFFTKSSYQDEEGYLYFGGVNGITRFDPLKLDVKPKQAPITFSKVSQGEKFYSTKDLKELTLQNDLPLIVRVSSFDYLSNRPLQLRYRVLPKNDWIEVETNEIVLHDFPEKLELQVQQLSTTGSWLEPGIALILKPSFKLLDNNLLWWFAIISIAIVSMVVLFLLYKNLVKQRSEKLLMLKREKAKQSLLMEEKLSLLHQVEDLHYSLSEQKYQVDKIQNELEQKSIKDELTDLYSRGYIIKNIQHELDNILLTWQDPNQDGIYLGIFCVEIDNFNSLKDQYGYIATNEILVQVADSVTNICYGSDIVARWQGSSLLILSRGISQREQMVLAEKIRNIIASRKFDLSNGKTIDITASVGFSRYPFLNPRKIDKQINWFKLIFLTETALSSAQTNSLNAWIGIFSNQFTDAKSIEEGLLNELPELINSGQLDYVSSIPKSKKIQWD